MTGDPHTGTAGFVVGFNPVPMAHDVATLGGRLRSRILWTLLGAAVWTGVWWSQRSTWGSPLWLLAGYSVSLVVILATLVRLLAARRHLARIGSGPAIEARAAGLRLHPLEGEPFDIAWQRIGRIHAAGAKMGAGPQLVVEAEGREVWAVPLSFLDALPGTIDAGLRACSAGRVGLDLSGLDALL